MGRIKNGIVKFGSAILKKFEYRYNQIMSKSIRLGYRGVGSIFEYPSVIGNHLKYICMTIVDYNVTIRFLIIQENS